MVRRSRRGDLQQPLLRVPDRFPRLRGTDLSRRLLLDRPDHLEQAPERPQHRERELGPVRRLGTRPDRPQRQVLPLLRGQRHPEQQRTRRYRRGGGDRPEGPYTDAIGRPLIAQFVNGAQPIDQDVFVDDNGQAYIYYGGWGHANVAKLNADMTSLGTFADGTTYKEITPSGYVEGPQMFKRHGKYYLMWSEGGWTGPNYSVAYAMADSPTGPFTRLDKVLAQDSAVARGAGHNSVLNIPGTDTWYIFYHRRPLSETDGNARQVAYDRMNFNADGTIQRVKMLVKDNFADSNALGWKTYGGAWSVSGGQYRTAASYGGKALLDDNHVNATYDLDVTVTSGIGDAGLVFRASNVGTGTDAYRGYYAGITPAGRVILGRADNNWTLLGSAPLPVVVGQQYHLRVMAVGSSIKVYVGDQTSPKISVTTPPTRPASRGFASTTWPLPSTTLLSPTSRCRPPD
ncbi:family 43 glycosylhydrolase [Micromonospora sp. STR1s_6]|uniref:Family 43 glycosylhydrolase n=1 Tax=Micromonospora tarensis TaxID=2806100 RepID=A0ABS1YJ02_9ACTN|nr:family 43 glycosylhydrolase [Micromonospora tarensis]